MDLRAGEPRSRCTATTKHGERAGQRCGAYAIRGGTVCNKHGGSAPQVRKRAAERLLALAEPAIVLLGKVLRDEKIAPADRIRAAIAVLDRTGFPAGLKIEAELDARLPKWQEMLRDIFDSPSEVEGKPKAKRRAVEASERKAVAASTSDEYAMLDQMLGEAPARPEPQRYNGKVIDGAVVNTPPRGRRRATGSEYGAVGDEETLPRYAR